MATFLGTENYSIDDKNRLVVPAGMRRVTGHKEPLKDFVLMRGLDGCIWLYAEEDWKRLEDLLQRLSTGNKDQRMFIPRKVRAFAGVFEHCAAVTVEEPHRST